MSFFRIVKVSAFHSSSVFVNMLIGSWNIAVWMGLLFLRHLVSFITNHSRALPAIPGARYKNSQIDIVTSCRFYAAEPFTSDPIHCLSVVLSIIVLLLRRKQILTNLAWVIGLSTKIVQRCQIYWTLGSVPIVYWAWTCSGDHYNVTSKKR